MNGAGSIPASVVTTPPGRPEALFRVGAAAKEGQLARAQMRTGPWMRGCNAGPCAGSLGVFLDDLLGNALLAGRPEDYWPVSTELSIDLAAPPPADGSVLTGQGWPVSLEPGGALGQGTVTDSTGAVIATATTRARYLPAPQNLPGGPGPGSAPPSPDDPASPESTMALLGAVARHGDGAVILTVPGSDDFANPMGNTHGGILLCAAEIAGSLALHADASPLQTSSIRVIYARSVPATDTITYTAEVLHRGRTLGVAQVTARGASGKTCAIATITAHDQALAS
ncbi:MAG: hypothetical protein JWL68_3940 [Actinomycetia bacterium]|nr:hypothetical protein [Actinomycetes bacterium]